ncbi:hypothetical protein Tco_1507527 [Tanacetum coccineum]
MPLMDEGGSAQKLLNLQQFSTSSERMTLDDVKAQMEEMKRLADLKAKKKKFKQRLKVLTDEELKAQAAKKLGIPPPPKLTAFEFPSAKNKSSTKRKRRAKVIHKVFVKDNVKVDGMYRSGFVSGLKLPPLGTKNFCLQWELRPDSSGYVQQNIYVIEAKEDIVEARRIVQVRDIVKEIKDYLKTYSSAGMDISFYVRMGGFVKPPSSSNNQHKSASSFLDLKKKWHSVSAIKSKKIVSEYETVDDPDQPSDDPFDLRTLVEVQFRRTSLIGFPAQSIRSSNAIALDSPYLLVLITRTSQSRQHVDTSLIHLESRKSPTKSLFDVGSRRISIVTVNTKEYHSDVLAIITRIMRRTY